MAISAALAYQAERVPGPMPSRTPPVLEPGSATVLLARSAGTNPPVNTNDVEAC